MSAPNLCTALSAELGELFRCSPHGSYQRIRTPYLYPDGDNIDIFCCRQWETICSSYSGCDESRRE